MNGAVYFFTIYFLFFIPDEFYIFMNQLINFFYAFKAFSSLNNWYREISGPECGQILIERDVVGSETLIPANSRKAI